MSALLFSKQRLRETQAVHIGTNDLYTHICAEGTDLQKPDGCYCITVRHPRTGGAVQSP